MEFRDVEWIDVVVAGFEAGTGERERGGENDGIPESQGVGGVGLLRGDVDPIVAGERRGIKPRAVGEEGIGAELGDRGF